MYVETDIVIVGAGLSGIHAATLLSRQGIDCVLLEAGSIPGGRVYTLPFCFRSTEFHFDMGASWYWPEKQPRMRELISSHHLETFPQFSNGSVWVERFRLERAQRYTQTVAPSCAAMRVSGGMKALIDALLKELPPGCLRVQQQVTAVEQRNDGAFDLLINGRSHLSCNRIISAIPPRHLADGIQFTPALPQQVQATFRKVPTWIAGQAKLVVLYETPFWRQHGHSGLVSSVVGPFQEIHDASPASGPGALFGFFSLSADQRQSLGESSLRSLAVAQLERLFGCEAKVPIGFLYHDWVDRPFVATQSDRMGPNGYITPVDLSAIGPLYSGKLELACSEFAGEHNGYLEGALESAERAVMRLSLQT